MRENNSEKNKIPYFKKGKSCKTNVSSENIFRKCKIKD